MNRSTESDMFLFERAEAEHAAAERKREATVTKATAVATLGAALIAIVAGPAFEAAGVADGATRLLLLLTIAALVVAIGWSAGALSVTVRLGERVSDRELGNWATDQFQGADVGAHARDFTEMYARATKNIRAANARAQARLDWAVRTVGLGLALLTVSFLVEVA